MKYILSLVVIVFLLCSCNTDSTKTTTTTTPVAEKKNEPSIGCFVYTQNKDNIHLYIETIGNMVNGNLEYNYFEKDRNSGTIQGKMKGDTMFAKYKFMSEGMESTRDVVFLRIGDAFTEGYGKINAKTGEPDLIDKASIKFDNKVILKKVDCTIDEHGCIAAFGSAWSVLKNNCVDLSVNATRLNPIEMMDKNKSPAYIIFSKSQSEAELFLPDNEKTVMLQCKGKEGNRSWENGDLKLIQWKGYVLKKGNLAIYGGM